MAKSKPVKHVGFNAVSNKVAAEYKKKGMNAKKAKQIGAATAAKVARSASPMAKKKNPRLNKVKG